MKKFKLIHFKITAFPVVTILKISKLLKTVILKLHYCGSPQKPLLVREALARARNNSRAEDWEKILYYT